MFNRKCPLCDHTCWEHIKQCPIGWVWWLTPIVCVGLGVAGTLLYQALL
ncbi:MAG: hypothetical protein ACYS29_00945 [Planctomycetota bacterium]